MVAWVVDTLTYLPHLRGVMTMDSPTECMNGCSQDAQSVKDLLYIASQSDQTTRKHGCRQTGKWKR